MIIYGWSNKVIKQAPVEKVPCGHCGNENLNVKIVGFYAHIFWIPLFPYKKKGLLECEHCKHAIEEKHLVDQMKEAMTLMKKSVKFPKYMFSGTAIILAFISYMFISSRMESDRELEYLTTPTVGDIYHLKDKDEPTEYKYYLWKVQELFEDSIYISANGYVYNYIPDKLMEGDGFYDSYYVIEKGKLKELYETGDLVKVQRGYSEQSGFDRILYEEPADTLITE
jgi:hypothetical protein